MQADTMTNQNPPIWYEGEEKMTPTEKFILFVIRQNNRELTIEEIAEITTLAEKSIRNALRNMAKNKTVERVYRITNGTKAEMKYRIENVTYTVGL